MAKIIFRPTCSSCLNILTGETIDICYEEELISDQYNNLVGHSKRILIEPGKCPYCGEIFDSIVMPISGKFPIKDDDIMSIT